MQRLRASVCLLLLVSQLLDANRTIPTTMPTTTLIGESTTDQITEIDPTTTNRPAAMMRMPKSKELDRSSPLAILVRLSAANQLKQLASAATTSPGATTTVGSIPKELEMLTGLFTVTGTFRLNV